MTITISEFTQFGTNIIGITPGKTTTTGFSATRNSQQTKPTSQ